MRCPNCDAEIEAEITDVMAATRDILTRVIDSANYILQYGTPAEKTRLTTTLLNRLMAMALSETEDVDETTKEALDDLLKDLAGTNE